VSKQIKLCNQQYHVNFYNNKRPITETSVSQIEHKRHFDIIEVIETESQAMLTTPTEHNFQDAFKKLQKRWEQCIHTEGDYLEGDGGQHTQS
jgi:hypothetical protein